MKKQITIQQLQTTEKAYALRDFCKNDDETAELLDITKVTMYTRFREHNWLTSQILYIDLLYHFLIKTSENENK